MLRSKYVGGLALFFLLWYLEISLLRMEYVSVAVFLAEFVCGNSDGDITKSDFFW